MKYRRFKPWMLNGCPGNITRPCKRFIVRGVNHGLVVTATTNGTHATYSNHRPVYGLRHNKGRAVDMGVEDGRVSAAEATHRKGRFQRAEAKRWPRRFRELFGPDNSAFVKDGRVYTIAEGNPLEDQHDNHVHGAPRW